MIGRTGQLAELTRVLDGLGAFTAVEVVGEPGMGKTSLVQAVRTVARARDLVVLSGKATEFERLPFAVFEDALDAHWPNLLSAVGTTTERHLLYRAARTLLAGLGPTVLLLDDVHWADEGSVELVDHLLRHPPDVPLLLVLAYRPRQLPARLVAALAEPSHEDWWHRVEVGPLTEQEADQLCGQELSRARRKELYDASGGNPFYLDALLRLRPEDGEQLPDSVRAALAGELAGLSVPLRVVAQAAAVLGEEFDADLLGAVAQIDDVEALTALDELAARDLVRQAGAPQRFRFRHPLLRSVVYGTAGAGWRLGAHARAARLLADRGACLAVQATHVERSASTGDQAAVDILVRAADEATALAPARAAHWLAEALRLLGGRANEHPELSMRLARTLAVAGKLARSRDILHDVLDRLPAGARQHRLAAVTTLAMVERLLGRPAGARRLLLDELGNGHAQAELQQEIAASALRGNHFPTAVSWGERALESAVREGEPGRVATVTALLALAHTFNGDTVAAAAHVDEAARMVDQVPDRVLTGYLESILRVGWTEVFLERYDEALRHLTRGLELARAAGQSYLLADLLIGIAFTHMWSGRLEEATHTADDAWEAALLVGSDELRTMAAGVGVAVKLWTGTPADALRSAEKALAEVGVATGRGPTIVTGMLAQAKLLTGDAAGARLTLIEAGGGETLPQLEFPTRPVWLRMLTQAELVGGDVPLATRTVARAEQTAEVSGLKGHRGHAAMARAVLCLSTGDPAGTILHSRQSVECFQGVGMVLYEGQARMLCGAAMVATGDRAGAMAEFGKAKALFAAGGAEPMFKQAEIQQRSVGGRNRRPTQDGPGQLSDRERQIAELVAAGYTNRQIGEELYMSPKTVEAHLSKIFSKLGVSSRAAVAAAWTQGC